MTPLLTVLVPGVGVAGQPRRRAARAARSAAAALIARGARLVRALAGVVADRGAPPSDPADRYWAVGTTLGHLVQDVR